MEGAKDSRQGLSTAIGGLTRKQSGKREIGLVTTGKKFLTYQKKKRGLKGKTRVRIPNREGDFKGGSPGYL